MGGMGGAKSRPPSTLASKQTCHLCNQRQAISGILEVYIHGASLVKYAMWIIIAQTLTGHTPASMLHQNQMQGRSELKVGNHIPS